MGFIFELGDYELASKLPNPFTFNNGTPVKTKEDWEKRREELYKTAVELQYGTQPPSPEFLEVEPLYVAPKNAGYRITTGTKVNPVSFVMRLYYDSKPSEENKMPVIVDGDFCFPYAVNDSNFIGNIRGKKFLFAYFDRTEIVPDVKEMGKNGQLYKAYPEYTFGAIGAWAWGYSRCVDALIKLGFVDEKSVIAFTGHSRGGKTALLAGILDKRANIVNPNETCAGGCSCYRLKITAKVSEEGKFSRSETGSDLVRNYGFWMGPDLPKYLENVAELPFDSHFAKAMIAPRVLFVSEAAHDIWANPIGTWQTTMAAKEVYKFLGVEDNIYWYFRDGYHAHKVQDVNMLLSLVQNYIDGTPLHEDFYRKPFPDNEFIFDWRCPDDK